MADKNMNNLFKFVDDMLDATIQTKLIADIPEGKDREFMRELIQLLNEYGIRGFNCVSFMQKFSLIGKGYNNQSKDSEGDAE